jgi:hypothetical protein
VREAVAVFEAKALVAVAEDPDFDPDTDPSLATQRQAVTDAEDDLATATAAFTAGDKGAIDAWEVAVPPPTMALAVEGLRAVAMVDVIKALVLDTPGGLLEALDDAEGDYAEALQAQLEADARH